MKASREPAIPDELTIRPLGSWDEQRRLGAVASARGAMEKEGLTISPVDLARLVDARLRRSVPGNPPDRATIAAEIEATLDLVEHCHWRIAIRRTEWRDRCGQWSRPYFEKEMSPEEKEARAKIEAEIYPLDFHKGLIRIGVSGDGPKQRDERFWPCVREGLIADAMLRHQYGDGTDSAFLQRSLEDFVEPSEAELRGVYDSEKRSGWASAGRLLHVRMLWRRYNLEHTKQKRSRAGLKSGEARKPKAKPSKRQK